MLGITTVSTKTGLPSQIHSPGLGVQREACPLRACSLCSNPDMFFLWDPAVAFSLAWGSPVLVRCCVCFWWPLSVQNWSWHHGGQVYLVSPWAATVSLQCFRIVVCGCYPLRGTPFIGVAGTPLHALPPSWSDLLETSTWTWTEAPRDENLASQVHSVRTALQQYLSMKRCSISATKWKDEWDIRVALQDTLPYILLFRWKKEHFSATFELVPLNHTPFGEKGKKEKQSTQGMLSFLGPRGGEAWSSSKHPNTILSFVSPSLRLKTSLTLCYWNLVHFPHK